VLWPDNRVAQLLSVVLILATLGEHTSCKLPDDAFSILSSTALSSINARRTCKAEFGPASIVFAGDIYGFSAFLMSWITNVWATGLIAVKAW
jgi:hypothetical protein